MLQKHTISAKLPKKTTKHFLALYLLLIEQKGDNGKGNSERKLNNQWFMHAFSKK
jgi:hypothetical protein